jgi:hypothetical protein
LRLGRRFRKLLIRMGGGIGESIPLACQDWANTKAAYRFFANKRVLRRRHFERAFRRDACAF